MLPNFFILGAQKAGTTTLAKYCEEHPDIFFSKPRETRFFIDPHLYSKGIAFFEANFFGAWNGETAVGEKTPEYFADPRAPILMRDMLTESLKFVVCLRSPAQRAHAGYRQSLMLLREHEGFERALALEHSRVGASPAHRLAFGYRERGLYARQVRNFQRSFPSFVETSLFLDFQDFLCDPASILRRLCEYLGVEYLPADLPHEGRGDLTSSQVVVDEGAVHWLGKKIKSPSAALQQFARDHQTACRTATRLSRSDELKLNRELFLDDIRELETLLSRRFDHWLD